LRFNFSIIIRLGKTVRPTLYYNTESMEAKTDMPTGARSSWIRDRTNPLTKGFAESLHNIFPGITANYLTIAGGIGVAAGSALRVWSRENHDCDPRLALASLGILIAGFAMDSIDGKMSKLWGTEGEGAVLDATVDRINNLFLGLTRMHTSSTKDSTLGEILAIGATLTGTLPSMARAKLESEGIAPNEGGKGALDFLGSHAGRTITGIFGIALPIILQSKKVRNFIDKKTPFSPESVENFPIQEILDAITIVMNVKMTMDRASMFDQYQENPGQTTPEEQQKAKEKLRSYKIMMGVSLATMLGAYFALHKNQVGDLVNYLSSS